MIDSMRYGEVTGSDDGFIWHRYVTISRVTRILVDGVKRIRSKAGNKLTCKRKSKKQRTTLAIFVIFSYDKISLNFNDLDWSFNNLEFKEC